MNEKLAVLTAVSKALEEPLNLAKLDAKYEMQDLYIEHGVTQKVMEIDGEKVGTISFTPPKRTFEIDPNEKQTALEWLYENGLAELKPVKGWQEHFIESWGHGYVHIETGEKIPWIVDSEKSGYSTVRLSMKPNEVLNRADKMLKGGIAGLLGGGDV